jgi:NAD(P)-dependent dehydrogenase (short-subunit alcohol dehydrogenase family)
MLPQFDLSGRRVLITGAGRGIGRGIALVMAQAGADVGVTALGDTNATKVAAEVTALGRRGYGWAADGTRVAGMEAISARVLAEMGGLDILVNCIGDAIPGAVARLPDREGKVLEEAEWLRVMDLNLNQPFVGCHVFGPHLLEQRAGCVINVSSFAAIRPAANMTAYASAKAGLTRFTESLALEWAPYGVRVNAIAPGTFPDVDQMTAEAKQRLQEPGPRGVPLGRYGDVREVGYLAVYLASEAAAYVTGQTICIDGGRTLT